MKLLWMVTCRDTALDEEAGDLSLLHMTEGVTVETGPIGDSETVPPVPLPDQIRLVSLWHRTATNVPEKSAVRIQFRSPTGPETVIGTAEIDLTDSIRGRFIASISGIKVDVMKLGAREVSFILEIEENGHWVTAGELPFEITVNRNPGLPPPRAGIAL